MRLFLILFPFFIVGCTTARIDEPIARLQGTWIADKQLAWSNMRTGNDKSDERMLESMHPHAGHLELTFNGLTLISRDKPCGTEHRSDLNVLESGDCWILVGSDDVHVESPDDTEEPPKPEHIATPRPTKMGIEGDVLWITYGNDHIMARDGYRLKD